MFHAAGWTFPWSITFACATQVSTECLFVFIIYMVIDYHSVSGKCANLEPFPSFKYFALLWSADSSSMINQFYSVVYLTTDKQ